jgi:hypothetical protein
MLVYWVAASWSRWTRVPQSLLVPYLLALAFTGAILLMAIQRRPRPSIRVRITLALGLVVGAAGAWLALQGVGQEESGLPALLAGGVLSACLAGRASSLGGASGWRTTGRVVASLAPCPVLILYCSAGGPTLIPFNPVFAATVGLWLTREGIRSEGPRRGGGAGRALPTMLGGLGGAAAFLALLILLCVVAEATAHPGTDASYHIGMGFVILAVPVLVVGFVVGLVATWLVLRRRDRTPVED